MDGRAEFVATLKRNRIHEILLLAAGFRTGSTLLGRLLSLQSGLDFHIEKFNSIPAWDGYDRRRRQSVLAKALSPVRGGLYGTKLMWPHLVHLARFLGIRGRDASQLLDLGIRVRVVRLFRRDQIAQAVSFFVARETGEWHSGKTAGPPPDVRYSAKKIGSYYHQIIGHEALWLDFIERTGLAPTTICYEDLVDDPRLATIDATRGFALSFNETMWPDCLPLKKQADDRSEEFRQRFLDDIYTNPELDFIPDDLKDRVGLHA